MVIAYATFTTTLTVDDTTATVVANIASPGDVLTCTIISQNEGILAAIRDSCSITQAVSDTTSYEVEVDAPTAASLALKSGVTVASETMTYNSLVTVKPSSSATFKAVSSYVQASV